MLKLYSGKLWQTLVFMLGIYRLNVSLSGKIPIRNLRKRKQRSLHNFTEYKIFLSSTYHEEFPPCKQGVCILPCLFIRDIPIHCVPSAFTKVKIIFLYENLILWFSNTCMHTHSFLVSIKCCYSTLSSTFLLGLLLS